MSYLVFCSFEVGGLPFRMADILNRSGYRTYYVSIHKSANGHDSTAFHYKDMASGWNLTAEFADLIDSDVKVINKLQDVSREYDIRGCIATGSKSFLLASAGIDYQYWSFGSDLDQICFYSKWPESYGAFKKFIHTLIPLGNRHRISKSIEKLVSEQVNSIIRSNSVIIAPYQIDSYRKICPGKAKSFFPHFFPQTCYESIIEQKLINRDLVKKSIGTDRFFFSSTRHFWSGRNRELSDNKGNDVIFHSFSEYLNLTGDKEVKLVLIAKGQDVAASAALAEELGLTDRVVWIDEMKRDDLKRYYSSARIAFGQFGTPVLAFTALEPLTEATPCISYFWDGRAQDVPFYEKTPPILNTRDIKMIAAHMARLMTDCESYGKASYDSWQWIQENCLEKNFARSIESMFAQNPI